MPECIPMTCQDTKFAEDLSTKEGWGFYDYDFKRLISLDPEGCFIARDGGKKVGIVCTSTYGVHAFIGCLIVEKTSRGKGIGMRLMQHAIDYLNTRRVTTIELDGVISAVPMYRKLGFKDKYLSLRFVKPGNASARKPSWKGPELSEVVAFDLQMTGIERGVVLARLLQEYSDSIFAVQKRSMKGYALVRERKGGFYIIGPIVAESVAVAEELLQAIICYIPDTCITAGVPEVSRGAVDIMLRRGFVYTQPSLRMYYGEKLDYESRVYAILGAEKG